MLPLRHLIQIAASLAELMLTIVLDLFLRGVSFIIFPVALASCGNEPKTHWWTFAKKRIHLYLKEREYLSNKALVEYIEN